VFFLNKLFILYFASIIFYIVSNLTFPSLYRGTSATLGLRIIELDSHIFQSLDINSHESDYLRIITLIFLSIYFFAACLFEVIVYKVAECIANKRENNENIDANILNSNKSEYEKSNNNNNLRSTLTILEKDKED